MSDHLHDDSSVVSVVLIVRKDGSKPWLFHSLSPQDSDTLVSALRLESTKADLPDDELRMWFNVSFFTAWRRFGATRPGATSCVECRDSNPDWFKQFSDLMRECHESMAPDVRILNPADRTEVPEDVLDARERQWMQFLERTGQAPVPN